MVMTSVDGKKLFYKMTCHLHIQRVAIYFDAPLDCDKRRKNTSRNSVTMFNEKKMCLSSY